MVFERFSTVKPYVSFTVIGQLYRHYGVAQEKFVLSTRDDDIYSVPMIFMGANNEMQAPRRSQGNICMPNEFLPGVGINLLVDSILAACILRKKTFMCFQYQASITILDGLNTQCYTDTSSLGSEALHTRFHH